MQDDVKKAIFVAKKMFAQLNVGFVPGFPGAHSQGESLDELNTNLKEVIEMLLGRHQFTRI